MRDRTTSFRQTMTYQELIERIPNTKFFSELGNAVASSEKCVFIQSLDYWADDAPQETDDWRVCDTMDWLPTTQRQPDPFQNGIESEAALPEAELKEMRLAVAKLAMGATRDLASPNLTVGPHDFTVPARGALVFALRAVVGEIVSSRPGPWHLCVDYYLRGHWPCGILPTGKVVVL